MESFVKGDVVVVPFPFNNLSDQKVRPAFVLAALSGLDIILCQITSKAARDPYSIFVDVGDFSDGSLRLPSNVRANQIFTFEKTLIRYRAGHLKEEKTEEIINTVVSFLRS
ncbi:MAG TPA: type II toxin-antitoxin system PemK/MazF family toxin [Bryobacteraceae bacterium]